MYYIKTLSLFKLVQPVFLWISHYIVWVKILTSKSKITDDAFHLLEHIFAYQVMLLQCSFCELPQTSETQNTHLWLDKRLIKASYSLLQTCPTNMSAMDECHKVFDAGWLDLNGKLKYFNNEKKDFLPLNCGHDWETLRAFQWDTTMTVVFLSWEVKDSICK